MFMLKVDDYYNVIEIITSNYPPVKLKDKGDCFIGKSMFADKIHLFQYVDEKPCLIKSVTFDTDREYKKRMRELIESI